MRLLIVDNNDSFTYNLQHYICEFIDNIDVIRFGKLKLDDVSSYDKILFSPGPGLPDEYPILHKVLARYQSSKSILGVCLGQQVIAEFYGGQLTNLSNIMHGVSSRVSHFGNCILYTGIPISFQVGHYHSWVVSSKFFPPDLEPTSLNEDGLIMSIKHRKYDVRSVQFHPESVLTEHGFKLIRNWIFS